MPKCCSWSTGLQVVRLTTLWEVLLFRWKCNEMLWMPKPPFWSSSTPYHESFKQSSCSLRNLPWIYPKHKFHQTWIVAQVVRFLQQKNGELMAADSRAFVLKVPSFRNYVSVQVSILEIALWRTQLQKALTTQNDRSLPHHCLLCPLPTPLRVQETVLRIWMRPNSWPSLESNWLNYQPSVPFLGILLLLGLAQRRPPHTHSQFTIFSWLWS
jgi:hypothetical protein